MFVSVALSPPAHASYWRLVASNCTATHLDNGVNFGPTWHPPSGPQENTIGLSIIYAGASSTPPGTTASASTTLSGTITGTWVSDPSLPSDPVPANTIVSIHATASTYSVTGGQTVYGGGKCDDGFGDLPDSAGVATGTHYILENTSPFTISVSQSASKSESVSPGSPLCFAYGSCGGVVISTYPITIDITPGTSNVSPLDFLIGQKVEAALDTHGLPSNPSDTYHWIITGGSPFDGYIPGFYSPLFSVQPNDFPTVYAYFATPGTAAFTCNAVLQGEPVTVTQSINVDAPGIGYSVDMGTPQITTSGSTQSVQLLLSTAPFNNVGVEWTNSILTPNEFIETSNTGESDYGNWEWVQLISMSDREYTDSSGAQYVDAYMPPPPASPILLTQISGLDTQYPYGGLFDTLTNAAIGNVAPADGREYWSSDAPATGLISGEVSDSVYETFQDTLMYQPPGNSCYVPLHKTNWDWTFDATNASGSWTISNNYGNDSDGGIYPAFPEWTYVLGSSDIGYITQVATLRQSLNAC